MFPPDEEFIEPETFEDDGAAFDEATDEYYRDLALEQQELSDFAQDDMPEYPDHYYDE